MFKIQKTVLAGILSLIIVVAVGGTAAYAAPVSSRSETASPALFIFDSSLSAEEAASLFYMREEEKLARDVYNALYAVWGQPVFSNIAASEQTHMDAIKVLLDRYGLDDPALGPGKFTNPDLQSLYNQLVAQGSCSLTDALKVGIKGFCIFKEGFISLNLYIIKNCPDFVFDFRAACRGTLFEKVKEAVYVFFAFQNLHQG